MTAAARPKSVAPHRVLFLDHTPIIGGAELALAAHLRALDRTRFEPVVGCTDTVPSLLELYRDAGADVHVMTMPRLRRLDPRVVLHVLRASMQLRSFVRQQHIDLVVANTSRTAYLASLALLRSGRPLIWWVRDFLFGRAIFGILAPTATRIIYVSDAVRRFYGGPDDNRHAVIYVGSDLDEYCSRIRPEQVKAERTRWGFTDDDVVVGFMGRLVSDKGPEDVIRAVAALHARDPRVRLLIVGSGRGQDGDVEEMLCALASERRWSFVVFAGFQHAEALYYQAFDIFVLGTRTPEPYATSAVQAMMAGTPVVATATGGTPELVRHRVTGMLVPPNAPARMADAIEELLSDADLRRYITATAQDYVLTHNREKVTTRQAETIYTEILRSRGS